MEWEASIDIEGGNDAKLDPAATKRRERTFRLTSTVAKLTLVGEIDNGDFVGLVIVLVDVRLVRFVSVSVSLIEIVRLHVAEIRR